MDLKRTYLESRCFFCLAATKSAWCDNCNNDFIFDEPRCPVCARTSFANKICGTCIKRKPNFTRTVVLYNYAYPGKHLIKALKFLNRPEIAKCIAKSFLGKLKTIAYVPDIIIPIPLHRKRQAERGYNQSLELAKYIGKDLRVGVNTSLCHRIVNTNPQSELPLKKRGLNVKNAFKLNSDDVPNHVVIVDDVFTTGSTVNELARILKKSGCKRVDVWAIARA